MMPNEKTDCCDVFNHITDAEMSITLDCSFTEGKWPVPSLPLLSATSLDSSLNNVESDQ